MILGIANRLDIYWGLAEFWVSVVVVAIVTCKEPHEMLPIWSVMPPTIPLMRRQSLREPLRGTMGDVDIDIDIDIDVIFLNAFVKMVTVHA